MNRRELLKLGGLVGASPFIPHLLGGGNQAYAIPRPPFVIDPLYGNDPLTLEGRDRSILVIGGGLAGLSASLELAERGYQVTLREASDVLGGRLATRNMSHHAGDFRVEHGLHMWFGNYHNFRDVRARLGIDQHFRAHHETHFTFRDYQDEILKSDPPSYPLNLIKLLERSPNLNLFSAFRQLGLLGDVLYYDHWSVYEQLDQITFEEWSKGRVSKTFYDVLLQPAASVTLNDPLKISAAEMVMYMHFFMMSQPKAMWREVTTTDHGTAIIDPWATHLRTLGVQIELNRPCSGLRFQGDRVVGILDDERDYDGVILATSIPGTKKILSQSEAYSDSDWRLEQFSKLSDRLMGLKVAPPYKVLRAWLDKPTQANRTDILETPQHKPVNLIALFHLLEDESRTWAQRTGGSVLEFHLYADEKWGTASDLDAWRAAEPIMSELYPELRGARLIDFTVGSYHDFTSFETGQGLLRPSADTPFMEYQLKGLAFAGDWVATQYPSALMERAVSTGREAANHFLLADRVRQAALTATARSGPGLL